MSAELSLAARLRGPVQALPALAVGAAGGVFFHWLGTPLAWMMGAMLATTAASLAGAPLKGPGGIRVVMVSVLGLMLGSAFTPETFDRAGDWWQSLTVLLIYVTVTGGVITAVLMRRPGFDRVTAFFSAAPGGFNEMVLMGGAMGGNMRTISLMHSMRILLAVMTIPLWFRLFGGYEPSGAMAALDVNGVLSLWDGLVLIACAIAGVWGGRRIGLPAAALVGPMLLSVGVHLAGLTQAGPPSLLIAIAQVVIGTTIGCRFSGVSLRRVLGTMMTGGVTTLLMLGMAAGFAYALSTATGLPFEALLLAFAPGGLAEMTLISLALNIDTAFVSTHHLARIFVLVVVVPVAFRMLARRFGPANDPNTKEF